MNRFFDTLPLLIYCLLAGSTHAQSANWPQFRGQANNGIATDASPSTEWNDNTNLLWKLALPGAGASSPVVWNDRVYLTCYSGYGVPGEASVDPADLVYAVVCVDLETGHATWTRTIPSTGPVAGYSGFLTKHGYATSTPAFSDAGVFCFLATTGLVKLSHDGEVLWTKDCGQDGNGAENWGSGSSPIFHDDMVIVHADVESSSIIAFQQDDGSEVWRKTFTRGGQNTRATPLLANIGGQTQLIFHSTMGTLTSLNPDDGELLWNYQGTADYQNPSPVTDGKSIFVWTNKQALALSAAGEKLWQSRFGGTVCTPLYYDGHLYWPSEDGGVAKCVNAATGDLVYEQRLEPSAGRTYASPVLADGKIYVVSREGGAFVIAASPYYKQLAHNQFASDASVFNATPAISGNRLLLRSDRFLYCIGQ